MENFKSLIHRGSLKTNYLHLLLFQTFSKLKGFDGFGLASFKQILVLVNMIYVICMVGFARLGSCNLL